VDLLFVLYYYETEFIIGILKDEIITFSTIANFTFLSNKRFS